MINLQRILHPTDFSHHAQPALEAAMSLCEKFEAELHLLHVLSSAAAIPLGPGVYVDAKLTEAQIDHRRQVEVQLAALVPSEWKQQHRVQRVLREGPPFVTIIEYARDAEIDLIVLGTHGRSGLVQMLLGSVAEKVVRKAPCPVLTVRLQGHPFVMP